MTWTFQNLMSLVGHTLRDPKEGASTILNFALPRAIIWQLLAVVVLISVVLGHATQALFSSGSSEFANPPFALSPFSAVVVHGALLVVTVYSAFWIGKIFGGNGSFEEALLLITWMQFIFVVLQVAQTVSLLFFPVVASLIGLIGFCLFFWLLTNFIAVLHGFKSLGLVLAGIIGSVIGIVVVLSIMLPLLGITLPGMGHV